MGQITGTNPILYTDYPDPDVIRVDDTYYMVCEGFIVRTQNTTQYILEERDDRKEFDGDTLPVHNDAFVEYSDSNFTEKSLLSLEKLEISY